MMTMTMMMTCRNFEVYEVFTVLEVSNVTAGNYSL